MERIETRIERIRSYMREQRLDAFLVSKPENVRYLSGFTGGADAWLLVSADENYILTDGRYLEQVGRECSHWELVRVERARLDSLAAICDKYNSLGAESAHLSYDMFQQIAVRLSLQITAQSGLIESFRMIKEDNELLLLQEAARIGDRVFCLVCEEIRPGQSERQVANRIAYLLKEEGCSQESFPTIAVAGENAALPHGQPGERLLQAGDMLTLDFGGFYQGYAGDMTRTVVIGQASPDLQDVYAILLEVQKMGLSAVRAGVSGRQVDAVVRDALEEHGLAQYFQHGTGHGVGLEIHEYPTLSRWYDHRLEANMVVTVEPGIYIPGWGGIRIEDTVIVLEGGCEVITHSPKDLLII
ncbi:MAG: Xaa-Pro peptidase family protein [Syntrophomonadaceae bacterium]